MKKRIRKHILDFSKKTIDGKTIVSGIGKFTDSIGYPLSFLIDDLKEKNMVVDWIDYIEYSIEKKWGLNSTLLKIEESLIDSYGREYSNTVLEKINTYLLIRI